MDTSEKYIEMCRKATKIQKMWQPVDGDFYVYAVVVHDPQIFIQSSRFGTEAVDTSHWIWLPRQDQLYELHSLYGTESGAAYLICRTFGVWLNSFRAYIDATIIEDQRFYSIEQLLLAFVMEDIGKRWDGSDWVECKC